MAGDGYLPRGASTVVPGGDGAALWAAPGDGLDGEFWSANGSRFVTLLEGDVERLGLAVGADGRPPPPRPRPLVPAWRSGCHRPPRAAGSASALLAHTLAVADAAGAPAYLEATSPRSRALYERFGFEVLAEMRAPGGPPMWAMWRRARRRGAGDAPSRAPWAMAPSVIANPTSWTGDSDSPLAIHPSAAPVTGAASPSSGGRRRRQAPDPGEPHDERQAGGAPRSR